MPMDSIRWRMLAVLLLSVSLRAATPGKEEEFKAAKDASNEADKWAVTQTVPVVSTPTPAHVTTVPAASLPGVAVSSTTKQPAEAAAPTTGAPATHQANLGPLPPGYNEMTGTILNMEEDPNVLRITLENGFNVGFTYDEKTVMTNGGSPIKVPDLYFGDTVQVRYFGKELRATEIERLKKAPRPTLGQ